MSDRSRMAKALGVTEEGHITPKGQGRVRTAGQMDAELRRLAKENSALWQAFSQLQEDLNHLKEETNHV